MVQVAPGTACESASASPALDRLDVEVDGAARTSFVHLPAGWDGQQPLPVVVSFHGADSNADIQRLSDGSVDKGDQEGIVVLHPEGLTVDVNDQATDVTGWDVTDRQVDEPAFVSALLGELGEQACIDLSRVYATGMSNDADMAVRSACALPESIAAVARVSAGNTAVPCDPRPPIPAIAFHGTTTRLSPRPARPRSCHCRWRKRWANKRRGTGARKGRTNSR